jgi:pyrroline-5-carboxylate reductase
LLRHYLETIYKIKGFENNKTLAILCNIIILAVKPQNMDVVLHEIADVVTKDKIVISIAIGLTINFFQKNLITKKLLEVSNND